MSTVADVALLGADLVDKDDRDVLESSRPDGFEELAPLLHSRGEGIVSGAWKPDASPVGFGERIV